jgi:hypothetical protein
MIESLKVMLRGWEMGRLAWNESRKFRAAMSITLTRVESKYKC